LRVARCQRLPEYGPNLIFFSGGSALRELSILLKEYTHNSVHLITPFDSGGSSAEIRRCFDMLSVGDLRNRLLALSDNCSNSTSVLGSCPPEVTQFFSHRLTKDSEQEAREEYQSLLNGKHMLAKAVRMPWRSILISHLRWFDQRRPSDFDLRGASVGNLLLTGCYLEHSRDIVTAISLIWTLLGAKGHVRPINGANLHLRTYYADGSVEVGQHKMGKGEKKKILQMDFVEYLDESQPQIAQKCEIDSISSELICQKADVIVYPMGSFFSSVLVNLLPSGVGRAIAHRNCPKLYIPNTGNDPELYEYTLWECIQQIVTLVRKDCCEEEQDNAIISISDILQYILVDTQNCYYCVPMKEHFQEITDLGITIIDVPLVDDDQVINDANHSRYNGGELVEEDEILLCSNQRSKSHVLSPRKVLEVILSLGS